MIHDAASHMGQLSSKVGMSIRLAVVLALLVAFATSMNAQTGPEKIDPSVRKLHNEAIYIDTHIDTLLQIDMEGIDIGKRLSEGQVDIPRMLEGGIDAVFFSVWPDPVYGQTQSIRRTLELIDRMYQVVEANSGRMGLAVNARDIRRLSSEGKVSALMGIEGGHAIEANLSALRMFHRLGVRYMTLAHSNTNQWADSSTDKPRWGGLNELGEKIVREMNRIGMIVDVSHVSDDTFFDAVRVSTKPVIFSHSSCRAFSNHPRNASDEMLRALKKNGGVIGINFYPEFLDQETHDKMRAMDQDPLAFLNQPSDEGGDLDKIAREKYFGLLKMNAYTVRPPFDRIVDHIDHVVKLIGVDHVGIGSDFGVIVGPQGADSVLDMIKITQLLKDRGYRDEQVKKILGGNFLRVFEAVTGQ